MMSLIDEVPVSMLQAHLISSLSSVVNACGVDVTAAAEHLHMRPMLQFVAGLGPKTAANIADRLAIKPVTKRSSLIEKNILGPNV